MRNPRRRYIHPWSSDRVFRLPRGTSAVFRSGFGRLDGPSFRGRRSRDQIVGHGSFLPIEFSDSNLFGRTDSDLQRVKQVHPGAPSRDRASHQPCPDLPRHASMALPTMIRSLVLPSLLFAALPLIAQDKPVFRAGAFAADVTPQQFPLNMPAASARTVPRARTIRSMRGPLSSMTARPPSPWWWSTISVFLPRSSSKPSNSPRRDRHSRREDPHFLDPHPQRALVRRRQGGQSRGRLPPASPRRDRRVHREGARDASSRGRRAAGHPLPEEVFNRRGI